MQENITLFKQTILDFRKIDNTISAIECQNGKKSSFETVKELSEKEVNVFLNIQFNIVLLVVGKGRMQQLSLGSISAAFVVFDSVVK